MYINTLHLFQQLDTLLISLLQRLSPADWQRQTIAKKWVVKDVAAHLLDGNIRGISIYRDNYLSSPATPIRSYQDLVDYLNDLNATWVSAMGRMSPELMTDLLASTGKLYQLELASLDPDAKAIFAVSWAGETESRNWFHIAREYTEKFIHQMQIRDAVGDTAPLFTRELFQPFIATFMHGLPYTYRDVKAVDQTVVEINIEGEIGGTWFLARFNNGWVLDTQSLFTPAATVTLSPDTAWRVFSKGITREQALKKTNITGDIALGKNVLNMISIMG